MFSPLNHARVPRQSPGFTLIELIVVVAILALLAALLLPAYNNVVARGQAAKCISNLKQIGAAVAGYAGDHDGAFPRGGWGGGGIPLDPPATDGIGWLTDIYPYLDQRREVFICPAGEEKSPTGDASWVRMPNGASSDPRYPMHYAYNAQLNSNRNEIRTPGWSVDRLSAVQRLSGLPVMIDVVFQNNFYGGVAPIFSPTPSPNTQQAFATRHSNMGNILWGDGSVSTMTAEAWSEAPEERIPSGDYKRFRFCKGDY